MTAVRDKMQLLGKILLQKVKFTYQLLLIASLFGKLTRYNTIYLDKRPGDQVVYEDTVIYDY